MSESRSFSLKSFLSPPAASLTHRLVEKLDTRLHELIFALTFVTETSKEKVNLEDAFTNDSVLSNKSFEESTMICAVASAVVDLSISCKVRCRPPLTNWFGCYP